MKTLDDVKSDMSALYDEFKSGSVKREDAAELANIAGKYLKAEQLELARDIFEAEYGKRTLPGSTKLPREPKRLSA